jgi:signal transduction histidine kinase
MVPNDQVITHLHPQDAARVREAAARVGADGSYGPIEHRIVRTDGSIRWVLAIGRIDPASGNTTGGALDITARKAQEERLAQAQKLDSIGRLAGGIAHDFNNMLTAILGYAELCIRRVPAGNPMVEDLREIRQAAERSRELTSRLLTFARKQRVEQRVVNTNAVVEHLERLLRRVVGEDVILTVNAHATRNVWIDPHQLEQLIVNLVTNARDAMASGGELAIETTDVEIEEADGDLAPGPHVLIRVVDTGTGIEPELLAHIFEPFFTTKEAGKGTGLGLAQCYGIAQQARGRLRVASTLGVGTRVTLELPAVAEPETAYGDAPGANRGGSETLLLVEDEAMIRALTVRILRDAGYRVLEADNGATALAVARAHDGTIDLLVTDMVIPGMTGAELVAQLRRERPGLAAVVMSGYAPQATSDLGAVTFLAKPFLPDELLATIHAVLTR